MKKKILIFILFLTCSFSLFLIPSKKASAKEDLSMEGVGTENYINSSSFVDCVDISSTFYLTQGGVGASNYLQLYHGFVFLDSDYNSFNHGITYKICGSSTKFYKIEITFDIGLYDNYETFNFVVSESYIKQNYSLRDFDLLLSNVDFKYRIYSLNGLYKLNVTFRYLDNFISSTFDLFASSSNNGDLFYYEHLNFFIRDYVYGSYGNQFYFKNLDMIEDYEYLYNTYSNKISDFPFVTLDVFKSYNYTSKARYLDNLNQVVGLYLYGSPGESFTQEDLDNAYENGVEDGINEGYQHGKLDGIQEGFDSGLSQGLSQSELKYQEGYDAAKDEIYLSFFEEYSQEMLGPFKDSVFYIYDCNNDVIGSPLLIFSDYAPYIYNNGKFDFKLLFELVTKDDPLFSNSSDSSYCFVFSWMFPEVTFTSFNNLLTGFNGCEFGYNDSLGNPYNSLINFENDTCKLNQFFGPGFNDVVVRSVKLFADSLNNEDKSLYMCFGESSYYHLGFNDGKDKSYDDGYLIGKDDGYKDGYDVAKDEFYDKGYSDGYMENNFSLQSLFWTIAGLPFESFKTIWDVNFLGIYIADFITGLLLAGVAIFIMKRVMF